MKRIFTSEFPLPPSANHLYGSRGSRRFIKKKGVEFYEKCKQIVGEFLTLEPPYKLTLRFYMPDKRRRDGGNLLKATEDALTKSGVIVDDVFIKKWDIEKCDEIIKGGRVDLIVEEM